MRVGHLTGTSEIFVNRNDPIRIFEAAANDIPEDHSNLLVFYGPGGQGKSALRRELNRRAASDDVRPYAFLRPAIVDLHGRDKSDPLDLLIWIRNGFAKSGTAFATFDVALALYWETSRAEKAFPILANAWLARSSEALVDVAPDAVGFLREVGEDAVRLIPGLRYLMKRGGRWVIDKSRRVYLEQTREALEDLFRGGMPKEPYEILALMPHMLAEDLNYYLRNNGGQRFVLLVDEYERVFDEAGAGVRWRENPFDLNMRTFVEESKGLLTVFFSREKLPWADVPEEAQHEIGGLTDDYADDWLERIPIEDEGIRAAIIDGSREEPDPGARIYPFMLDLQVQHWQNLTKKGGPIDPASFHLKAETFEDRRRELVDCVLRDYGDALQTTLLRLSVADRFDKTAFEHVIERLKTGLPLDRFDRIAGLSFMSTGEDGFLTMHRAIADVIRTMLDEEMSRGSIEALLEHYEARASVASPRDVTDETVAALREAVFLRRHQGAEGYVDWLERFSNLISGAARFAVDEHIWRESLPALEGELGDGHSDVAKCYDNIAIDLGAQGLYEAADPFLRKALAVRKRLFGDEDPFIATSYNNIAANLGSRGLYADAEPLNRKALDIRLKRLGEMHPNTATSFFNVASNLKALGQGESAEPLYRKALEISKRVHGEEHTFTAKCYEGIASSFRSRSQYEAAGPLIEKALNIQKRILGENHPDMAQIYNSLAVNLAAMQQHVAAEPHYRKALKICKRVFGEDHPFSATGYNNLATNMHFQGNSEGAETYYRKALEISKRVLGEDHPLTSQCYNNVAFNLDIRGQYEAAEPLYRKALEISERVLGEDHPQTRAFRSNLQALLGRSNE